MKICVRVEVMVFVNMKNRISHLWYLLTWIILLSTVVVTYHMISDSDVFRFTPDTWTIIDNGYIIFRGLFVILIVTNIMSLIFHEIKYAFSMEHLMIRKFLPTIRFITLLVAWIIWGFIILEEIWVNTSSLLTGAGIWWAIVALAAKDIIANLLWSLSIIMSKTFEIGETIRIIGSKWATEGIIEEINLNYTKVMNTEGKVVFIPNRVLNTEQIENLSRRRFYVYTFKVPFKKACGNPDTIEDILMLIEGKITEYAPIDIEITTEIPNANDFVYIFTVNMPEESEEFERDIRNFLIPYIFPREKS